MARNFLRHIVSDTAKATQFRVGEPVFETASFFTSTFDDITDHARNKVQGKSLDCATEVASRVARFRPGYWCFCGPGSEQIWKYNESRPTSHFADGGVGTNLASVRKSEFVTSEHPVFQVFKYASTRSIDTKKGDTWNVLQKNELDKQSHAREHGIGVRSTLSATGSENWIR